MSAIFEVDLSRLPKTCFPVSFDRSSLVDISCVGDEWAKFLDTKTNKTIDCKEWATMAGLIKDSAPADVERVGAFVNDAHTTTER